jgi:hypothetical protein
MEGYTLQQLQTMNAASNWDNRILLPRGVYDPNKKFKIHATWKADLDGRYWQAIRAEITITNEVKQIYNLM